MKTGDEGHVCSECGIYIPRGVDAVMAGGGRVLCAECTRKDAKKQASESEVGSPQQQQAVGAPAEENAAFEILLVLLVVMAVLSGLAAVLAGALFAGGSPSAPYLLASGVVGCLLWSWMAAVLRVLLDIRKSMRTA
jgi:hypothetical protein